MLTRIRWCTVVLIALALVGLGASLVARLPGDDPANLLVNSSVEEGSGDRPSGWRPIALPAGQGQVQFAWDVQRSHEGTHSLRI